MTTTKFDDDQLEALGKAADQAVWKTPRRPKTYHARDTYRYADADRWEREENIAVGRLSRCILLEGELKAEREHADRWQKLAGCYDDIRGWLRICEDNPEGHAEFYRECCLLIFGEYRDESADS